MRNRRGQLYPYPPLNPSSVYKYTKVLKLRGDNAQKAPEFLHLAHVSHPVQRYHPALLVLQAATLLDMSVSKFYTRLLMLITESRVLQTLNPRCHYSDNAEDLQAYRLRDYSHSRHFILLAVKHVPWYIVHTLAKCCLLKKESA
jgi:hypothetical protein